MYDLRPPYVLMLDEVLQDERMAARAQRLLAALPPHTPTITISVDDLPDAAQVLGWSKGGRMGMPAPEGDPGWFFGKMRWDGRWAERVEAMKTRLGRVPGRMRQALGYDAFSWFQSRGGADIKPCADHVCRPAWRIHLVSGCPHKCFYCSLGTVMTMMLNVEEYIVKLRELSQKNPWQKTWLYEDDSEALAQEPEYGGLPAVMEFCATSPDNYVIVHTKSANVDWMRDEDHRGRTILVWSLTGETQSRLMEPATATTTERIEAAGKCDAWGYTTRYKFKPIVPVLNWRDELAEMTRQVFERSRPDLISLFTLAWMDHSELCRLADTSLIDPRFLAGAEAAAEDLNGVLVRPFPHELRREVYEHCIDQIRKYDRDIPISLCTESLDMWRELGPRLGLNPASYPCGCGPQATPRLTQLPVSPWEVAQPVQVDNDPVTAES